MHNVTVQTPNLRFAESIWLCHVLWCHSVPARAIAGLLRVSQMWTKGPCLLLPGCRSWVEHKCQRGTSQPDVSEPGIPNKQFLPGTVRANDALGKQKISSEFVPNDFQAEKGGMHRRKDRLKVGKDPCLTLAWWERCSREVKRVVVLAHKIQLYLQATSVP